MAWKLPTTRVITEPEPVQIGGVNHPANIFTLWSVEKLAAIGVETIPDPVPTQADQEAARQNAYRAEADPLFCAYNKALEIDKDTEKATYYKMAWIAKVAEIRVTYPYPVE